MRLNSTTIFFVLFALTLIAVNHYIVSGVETSTEFPTGPEWDEHRRRTGELERKMMERKDPTELEKLHRQHAALVEQWRERIRPTR